MNELKGIELKPEKVLKKARICHVMAIFVFCFFCVLALGISFFEWLIGFPVNMLLLLLCASSWLLPTFLLLGHMSYSLRQQYMLMQRINDILEIVREGKDTS